MPPDDAICQRYLAWLFLAGAVWRISRYLAHHPIWEDEAEVALQLLGRSWLGYLEPIGPTQVSPLLFLWAEHLAVQLFGTSELALHLPALLAGLIALALFARVSQMALGGWPGVLAFGLLACAYYPTRFATELKPYSFDLLASALLIWATLHLWRSGRVVWLFVLIIITPVTLAMSFPAVFIAGGVTLAVGRWIWMRRAAPGASDLPSDSHLPDRLGRFALAWAALGVSVVGSFLVLWFGVMAGQAKATEALMQWYWRNAFPPRSLFELPVWLISTHTGLLFAYPAGDKRGGSTLTFVAFLVGLSILWKRRPRYSPQLVLCISPFLLTLVAATLRRYPYGESNRIVEHLAPIICLLAGLGTWRLMGRLDAWRERRRLRPVRRSGKSITVLVLLGLAATGTIVDVVRPYKRIGYLRAREVVELAFKTAGPTGRVYVLQPKGAMSSSFEWYLRYGGERADFGVDPVRLKELDRAVVATFSEGFIPPPGFHVARELQSHDAARRFLLGPLEQPPDYARFMVLERVK